MFLLVMYLMILAMSTMHVHECEENAVVCQDCVEHVKHNAHISQASIMCVDCVLCKIIHNDYITPEVLTFSAAVLLVLSLTVCPAQDVICRKSALPSLRAPPVVG